MLTVLLAASPGSGMGKVMLPVLEAFAARGHRVVFIADAADRDEIELRGAKFIAAPVDSANTPIAPSRFLPGVQQIDAVVRNRFLKPLRQQWDVVQETVQAERVDVVVTDPQFIGASALAQLRRGQRPGVIVLGGFPLPLSDPSVAPYGLGLMPGEDVSKHIRNAVLRLLIEALLHRVTRDVKRELRDLTGRRLRGSLLDAARYADIWAQLTVPRFEYPRSRTPRNLHFIGPLHPLENGALPHWWDYDDPRPIVSVRHEHGTPLSDLVIPAIEGLQHEDVLLVVTGVHQSAVAAAYRNPLPPNVRVAPEIPYSHLFASTRVAIKPGDYIRTHYALRGGVPLVVAGTTEEHVENNARVQWAGVGINLRTAHPTPAALRTAVLHVLADPSMRRAASRIAAQIAHTHAENTLCDLAEHLATSSIQPINPLAHPLARERGQRGL